MSRGQNQEIIINAAAPIAEHRFNIITLIAQYVTAIRMLRSNDDTRGIFGVAGRLAPLRNSSL